ncbi:MAG: hypothetical protein GX591_02015 [Planctomycetes bacterium]|nr:hypothetical protein [Planctomycetota bacterium]
MAKTDQPGLIELHAEKIALAVSAVIMIAVGALWVIRSPNVTTDVGTSSEAVQPAEIDDILLRTARQVQTRIENLPTEAAPERPAARELQERLNNPLGRAVAPSLVPLTEGPARRELSDGPIKGRKLDDMPALPSLAELDVWVGQEFVASSSAEAGMMGVAGGEAKDVTTAHVTAVLDYKTMVKSWQDALDGTGVALDIRFARVVALRQARLADGQWGPAEEIETSAPFEAAGAGSAGLPKVPAYRDGNFLEVRAAIDALGAPGVQQAVIQPSYPRVYWPEAKGFGGWMHHLPRTSVSGLEGAIAWPDQEPDLSGMAIGTWTPTPAAGPAGGATGTYGPGTGMYGPGPGAGTGMYGPGGGTGMYGPGPGPGPGTGMYGPGAGTGMYGPGPGTGAPRTPAAPRVDQTDTRRTQAERAVQQATEALNKAEAAMQAGQADEALDHYRTAEVMLARASEQDPSVANASGLGQRIEDGKARAQLPMLTRVPVLAQMCLAGQVQLWLHDTTCKPGEVYRYKLRVEVCNPLFMNVTPGTRPDDAPAVVVATESDWSEPIETPRQTEFFVTDGGNGTVRFTIFRRTHGQVLAQKTTVSVGDPIGSVESCAYVDPLTRQAAAQPLEVDFSTGYVLVDCDLDKQIAPKGTSRTTAQATLLSPDGTLVVRTAADDRATSRYRELNKANGEAEQLLKQLAQPLRP